MNTIFLTAARNGKRVGDAMRAGVRGRAAGYDGSVHAKIVGHPSFNGRDSNSGLHIFGGASEADWTDGGDIGGGRNAVDMDDPSALCVRAELSGLQIPAGAEQDDGHVRHISRGFGRPKSNL